MNALLFNSTLVIYAIATVLYLSFLVKSSPKLARTAQIVLAVGFLVHLGYTLDRYFEAGHTPITNLHESLSFFSMAVVGIYLFCENRYKVSILGSFVTPIALLILAVSATRLIRDLCQLDINQPRDPGKAAPGVQQRRVLRP